MWQLDCHVCNRCVLSKEEPPRCHPEALCWKSTDPWPVRAHVLVGRGKKRLCTLCGRGAGGSCLGRPYRDHATIDREIVVATAAREARERAEAAAEKLRKCEGAKARAARKKAQKLGLDATNDVFDGH